MHPKPRVQGLGVKGLNPKPTTLNPVPLILVAHSSWSGQIVSMPGPSGYPLPKARA